MNRQNQNTEFEPRAVYETPTVIVQGLTLITRGGTTGMGDSGAENEDPQEGSTLYKEKG